MAMSALPPIADIGTQRLDVCFVPKADIGLTTAGASAERARRIVLLVTRVRLHCRLYLCLYSFQIEARAPLHRWEVDRSLGELSNPLLHEYEAPELIREPISEEE